MNLCCRTFLKHREPPSVGGPHQVATCPRCGRAWVGRRCATLGGAWSGWMSWSDEHRAPESVTYRTRITYARVAVALIKPIAIGVLVADLVGVLWAVLR